MALTMSDRAHAFLSGELPLAIGVLKANGCNVDLYGNQGFTLSSDISAVATATKLDLSHCHLRGAWMMGVPTHPTCRERSRVLYTLSLCFLFS